MLNKAKIYNLFFKNLPSKRRFRFFLLFILLSFTFWSSTKLSKNYSLKQSFLIVWTNIPKGIILSPTIQKFNISITATGIEILLYRLFEKPIMISLSELHFSGKKTKIILDNQKFLIQQQLFDNTIINDFNPKTIDLNFSRLDQKSVLVIPKIQINLRAGYLIDSDIKISPDSIIVYGPKSILDSLSSIKSEFLIANDVYKNLRKKLNLKSLPNIKFSKSKVTVDLNVSRYTEKEFVVNVEVINLPPGIRVKLFPPEVKVRTTLPFSILRSINASDFILVVDYEDILAKENKLLKLKIKSKPPLVKKISLDPKKVNYLIRR